MKIRAYGIIISFAAAVLAIPALLLSGCGSALEVTEVKPRTGEIHVQIGKPISPEEVAGYDEAELVERVAERIRACQAAARRHRCRARR